jgi:hypothetical protein
MACLLGCGSVLLVLTTHSLTHVCKVRRPLTFNHYVYKGKLPFGTQIGSRTILSPIAFFSNLAVIFPLAPNADSCQ